MIASSRKPILRPAQTPRQYCVTVDSEQCDGCMLCVEFCPLDVLTIGEQTNRRMLHYVVVDIPLDCLGCLQCERICPSASIFVTELTNEP